MPWAPKAPWERVGSVLGDRNRGDRETDRETERRNDKDTRRQRDRETERQRDRERTKRNQGRERPREKIEKEQKCIEKQSIFEPQGQKVLKNNRLSSPRAKKY